MTFQKQYNLYKQFINLLINLSINKKMGNDFEEFFSEIIYINWIRLRVFGLIAIVIFIALLSVDLSYISSGKYDTSIGYKILFTSHIVVLLLLIVSAFLSWVKITEKSDGYSPYHRYLINSTLLFGMFNIVAISIGDVFINGSVAAYIGAVFSFASIFIMTNEFCIIFYEIKIRLDSVTSLYS